MRLSRINKVALIAVLLVPSIMYSKPGADAGSVRLSVLLTAAETVSTANVAMTSAMDKRVCERIHGSQDIIIILYIAAAYQGDNENTFVARLTSSADFSGSSERK
jgi:hypothetical protein